MQSQQKRVKWSRGETAEALEERTDTGITQASVELMENCIPDIYGNISRRPALKPIPLSTGFKTNAEDDDLYIPVEDVNHAYRNDKSVQFVPFYISEDDIILICVNSDKNTYIRIKDGKIVYEYNGYNNIQSIKTGYLDDNTGNMVFNMVSYAQQNNYMLIATDKCVYKVQFTFANTGYAFTPIVGLWEYTAGWYAPNGTQTKEVSSSDIAGLSFDSSSIGNYIYTETNGSSTVYSWIKTGINGAGTTATWTAATTTLYVTTNENITNVAPTSPHATFTMTNGTTYTSGQVLTTYTRPGPGYVTYHYSVYLFISGDVVFIQSVMTNSADPYKGNPYYVTASTSINTPTIASIIPAGCIVQFPNNGAYMRVEGYDSDGSHLRMYGSFLTPVADDNTTDTRVNVEYGYESLQPSQWSYLSSFPHPTELTFLDQRLWAGGWASSLEENYSLVIGSQIARYDDLKNNYNQENEPITLDILTQFKEKVTHLVDYNGLKIFTDSFEYAYNDGAIVKQSANGSTEWCEPIVFEGLCLYVDSTGNQIRAMQYEFQSNIFNSSCINQLAPHDLIWYPTYMSSFEDKIYSTGKHLFVVNEPRDNNSILAVCNFVPSNQANIWSRWSFPQYAEHPLSVPDTIYKSNMVHSIINTKNKPIFVLKSGSAYTYGSIAYNPAESYTFCVLDYEGNLDLEGTITADNEFAFNLTSAMSAGELMKRYQTLVHTDIAIYSNGEYQFTTTTDRYGKILDDISELTNVTAGLMINSTIRSHPIDVGGKTKSIKKRIGKTVMSVHDTEAGAITINGKTGYMNPQGDKISFYGVTGMKDEIKYTLTNKNGAMFHLESLLMNIEYGTLDS